MGSTVETVVSSSMDPGPTRLPICALAMPAMPSTGDMILVKPRSTWAFSTVAWAATIEACAASTDACAAPTAAWAALTAASVDWSAPMASSRSFWLTAFCSARGLIRFRLALAVTYLASVWATSAFACSREASALFRAALAWSRRHWPGPVRPERGEDRSQKGPALSGPDLPPVVLRDEVALDLGTNRGVNRTVRRRDPFRIDRNIPLDTSLTSTEAEATLRPSPLFAPDIKKRIIKIMTIKMLARQTVFPPLLPCHPGFPPHRSRRAYPDRPSYLRAGSIELLPVSILSPTASFWGEKTFWELFSKVVIKKTLKMFSMVCR